MEKTHHLAARLYPQLQSPKLGLSCFLCFPGEPRLEPLKRMKLQSLSEVREGHSVVGLGGEQEECCRADSSLCEHFFFLLFLKTYFGHSFSYIVKIAFSEEFPYTLHPDSPESPRMLTIKASWILFP